MTAQSEKEKGGGREGGREGGRRREERGGEERKGDKRRQGSKRKRFTHIYHALGQSHKVKRKHMYTCLQLTYCTMYTCTCVHCTIGKLYRDMDIAVPI